MKNSEKKLFMSLIFREENGEIASPQPEVNEWIIAEEIINYCERLGSLNLSPEIIANVMLMLLKKKEDNFYSNN